MSDLKLAADGIRQAVLDACRGLVERETLVELVVLCAVASEHLLVIGPPGTAKSEAARRISRRLGGQYFEYLVGRFTEPSEIFGPINLRKLKEGIVETETAGMLPEADIAFLDEVFHGSTAILNTLLSILNERTFRRGHTQLRCPLRVCVGASNRLPDDDLLSAFADRFLVRVFVDPVPDCALEDLLSSGWSLLAAQDQAPLALKQLDLLAASISTMDLTPVQSQIAHGVRLLRAAGIEWTDRRIVRSQRLIAAASALAGRERPTEQDLWPMIYALPTQQAQQLGRDVLRALLAPCENRTLAVAAAESALGARARGAKILRESEIVLAQLPKDATEHSAWRLRLEGIAREIDATFTPETLLPELACVRERIVISLAATTSS